jgi:hypothetical protein
MKTKTANSRRLDILGNVNRSSDQEIFTASLKQWRQKLGYCSLFAAIPAVLDAHVPVVHSDEAKQPEASVAAPTTRLLKRLDQNRSNPALLKRQSEFLLPHQKGSFDMTTLGGNDDCPGRAIPGGNYTAAAPYIDSGDTTGANDTVSRICDYYYGLYCNDALGPDLIYTFTVTGRGPNPQIQVSTTSGTYRPLIYVLGVLGGSAGACPSGTGNTAYPWVSADSRSTTGSTATLNSAQMNSLPLNVPLYLFVDSARNDASGSGSYTVRIQDVTIAPANSVNQIDDAQFFVRQQYLDFLNREPDQGGWDYWTAQITQCGDDPLCVHNQRINVSAAFFIELEFQQTGSVVYRLYRAAYGTLPDAPSRANVTFMQFMSDRAQLVGGPGLPQSTIDFANNFVSRPAFTQAYPNDMSPSDFVIKLFGTANLLDSTQQMQDEMNALMNGSKTRVQVLLDVIDIQEFKEREYNPAFVLMQYFGYLGRDPDQGGYDFWLNVLNNREPNNFRGMVCSFITSAEYQLRFGQVVTRSNAECAP